MTKKNQNLAARKSQETFNSITRKTKVENQNQTHNSKKEGIAPINNKY